MIMTYQYRLVPSRKQHRALEELSESQRQLYNAALEERIGAYRHGVTLTYIDQTKHLAEWRQSDAEAASVPSNLQRATLKRLDAAYKRFYQRVKKKAGKAGFPRFRGKGWWDSFGFREFSGITFDGKRVHFKGMPGGLRVHVHRPMPKDASIRCCTFRRHSNGWKIGFVVDVPVAIIRDGERSVGVDLGISTFAALSDGGFIPSLKAARRAQRRMRVAQRSLGRKKRGSKSRHKARIKVAHCHKAVARARSNHLHQASARLMRDYDTIALEALNVLGLARSVLAREVHDASWGRFLSIVRYKAVRAGVRVIEVDPRSSSQECSGCGITVPKTLGERWHDCPHCGLSLDRDLNAARNILGRAGVGPCLPNVAGCGKRAGGNLGSAQGASQAPRLPNRDTTQPSEHGISAS
jgi:putative transposase